MLKCRVETNLTFQFARAQSKILRYRYDDWKKLSIPDVSPTQQEPIVAVVEEILDAKRAGLEKVVSRLEEKLDREVAKLYGICSVNC